jgi:hypothetical protein
MRKLNAFEKSIINRIVVYHKQGILSNYASIIDHLLQNKDIVLDYQNRTAELHADMQFYQEGQLATVIVEISIELAITTNLLRDLEQNGYVTTLLEVPINGQRRYGQLIEGNTFISYGFVDPRFVDLLLDYSFKSIIVGQSLLDFVKNGYQTNDEKTNKRKLIVAVVALVVSTILNLVSLSYNIYSRAEVKHSQRKAEESIKIDNLQYDTIRGDLKELRNAIEESKTGATGAKKIPSKSKSGKK